MIKKKVTLIRKAGLTIVADISFDDDEYPNDTGSDSKDDAPTGGSVPSMPNDEFYVSLDEILFHLTGSMTVFSSDPSVSPQRSLKV